MSKEGNVLLTVRTLTLGLLLEKLKTNGFFKINTALNNVEVERCCVVP